MGSLGVYLAHHYASAPIGEDEGCLEIGCWVVFLLALVIGVVLMSLAILVTLIRYII